MAGQPEPFARVERPFGSDDKVKPMHTVVVITSLRVVTWCCVLVLGVLSLLPAQEMVRTWLPGRVEHIIVLCRVGGDRDGGLRREPGVAQIIGGFWVYAGILEHLQHFSPGRHPALGDFAASALGALCGGLVIAFVRRCWLLSPPIEGYSE